MVDSLTQKMKYVVTDFVMLNIAWLVYTIVRYSMLSNPTHDYTLGTHLTMTPVILGQIIFPLMLTGIYWLTGYYNNVFFKSRIDEIVNTAAVSTVGVIMIFFIALIDDAAAERLHNYEMLILLWALLFAPVVTGRLIITTRTARRIHNREIAFNTLVIGTGQAAINVADKIENDTHGGGFRIVGLVSTNSSKTSETTGGYKVYDIDNLAETIRQLDIKRLIIVPHHNGMRHTSQMISSLINSGCQIYVTPDLYGLIISRPRIANIINEPLIDITATSASAMTANCKRVADVVLSAAALMVLSPLYAAIAVAVKRDSKGPVLYRQERIGYLKKPFYILKFRSMTTDAESSGPALSSLDDPRITRIGHFLRKYRLDELPQFWNVLRGDMSLVGPRPEREYYIRQIVARAPHYTLIHQVRPGITSWGMVKYGYASNVDQMIERLRYDLLYIENVGIRVDLKILFHTVNTVLTGKGL